ncbi:MAG: PLP-dependent aminotransferase family protein [Chloroflexota bacterium]|nr:MAG: PLP-dependent aminotransferase family protein [Chloroflexota bacterium]
MSNFYPATMPSVSAPEITLATWAQGMRRSILREMIATVSRPGILSFAGGLPAPELFPAREYAVAVQRVLADDARALQYGPPYPPLKRHIVRLMADRGVCCTEEQVFLTTGAQQALNVITHLLLNPGGRVALESLVYSGIRQAVMPFQPDVLSLPTDLDEGLAVDALERYLRSGERPAYLYAIPEAHNPLGVSLSRSRKQTLVDLAQRHGFPIVEDDPYGFLYFDDRPAPPMRALDDQWVFYVGSFSKILAPALRLGWLIAPEELVPKLTVVKEAFDLESSALTQRSVSAYLDAGHLPGHLEMLRREYRLRRDAMLDAMVRHFPQAARWTKPSGGMFIWVELPAHVNTAAVLNRAVEEECVAFIPGNAFDANPDPTTHMAKNCLRLSFANCAPEVIFEGIGRLGRLLHRFC